jgi:hypothetical protein
MILSAVSGGERNAKPLIPLDTAADILHYLIRAAQGAEGYSILLTSRWIRCLVRLVVGGSNHESQNTSLKLVEEVVEQALVLATAENARKEDAENDDQDTNMPDADLGEAYPAEGARMARHNTVQSGSRLLRQSEGGAGQKVGKEGC